MDQQTTMPVPQNPIVLTPGKTVDHAITKEKRGFLATFGILFSGWLLGNLILLTLLSLVGIYLAGSTGLVKVPVLSDYLFGKPTAVARNVDETALESAQGKISEINTLQKGETVKELSLSEEEINALFNKQTKSATDFPIGDPNLKLTDGKFIFTGKLSQTNAPVTIEGKIAVSGVAASVNIVSAKFGKFNLPGFIASNIIENNLAKIGLSLNGTSIPAKSLIIGEGNVDLKDVSNPSQN